MQSAFALAAPPSYFGGCSAPFLDNDSSLSLSSSGELDGLFSVPDVFPAEKPSDEGGLWDLDLLFSADSGSEAATVLSLTPTASDASTRLQELLNSPRPATPDQCLPLQPAVPLKLAPSGLNLKLDCSSVAHAWGAISGGRPAIAISAAELARVAVNIPSLTDKAASVSAEAAEQSLAQSESSRGSAADADAAAAAVVTEEDGPGRKAALARYKEKRRDRSSNPNKKVRYEMRRINAEKRPRIKGRFVKRSELELYLAQQKAVAQECMVPAC